ncbi:hinge domain of cleavage stimulation factor subunit 2-domain-containing protein [Crucibulum laeve]|uniref:Hinge domain of cleavage stimulation factor subunit 2-domain-containing protein n=1 Tax=Crucibulum laeve TaxID=68775 RepID=A0A5C3LFB3_9AGAR|nr:hinge domain of cleavage stimulation factor subunit 2-domain-containing protein [Crucibulum laeve]
MNTQSKVVFVGNVPYNMGEDQLIDIFKSVGQVVGFRLVFDRDTGKPKGYGFCEFAAVRNLNNYEVGGRPLRIDLADSDPFLEGKTTVRGELMDGGVPGPSEPRSQWRAGGTGNRSSGPEAFLAGIPPGKSVPNGSTALDKISHTLATMQPSQLMEVLAQMKAFVITYPDQARTLLVKHPQFAYALFQSLLLNKIVDPTILQRMLAATGSSIPVPSPVQAPPRPPVSAPPHFQQQQAPHYPPHPPPHGMPPFPPSGLHQPQPIPGMGPPPMSAPPPSAMFGHHQQQHMSQGMLPPPMPPYHRQNPTQSQPHIAPLPMHSASPPMHAPPRQQPAPQTVPEISDAQKTMILQVFNMTEDQINALPETERKAIQQLRSQFLGTLGV